MRIKKRNAKENTRRVKKQADDEISTVKDRPLKSIFKAITWRVIASVTTFCLAFLFFSDDPKAAQKATGVAVAEAGIKMLLYYFHERAWANVKWGRMKVIIRRNGMIRRRFVRKIKLMTYKRTA